MKNKMYKFEDYHFEVMKSRLFNLQVCSNCPPEEIDKIEEAVKLHSPAGIENNWYIEKEGKLAPVKCKVGKGWHYIFTC